MRKKLGTGGGPPPSPPKYTELEAAAVAVMEGELHFAEIQYDSITVSAQNFETTDDDESTFIVSDVDAADKTRVTCAANIRTLLTFKKEVTSSTRNTHTEEPETHTEESHEPSTSARSTPKIPRIAKSGKTVNKEESLRLIQECQEELHKMQLSYYSNFSKQVHRVADHMIENLTHVSSKFLQVTDAVIMLVRTAHKDGDSSTN